MDNNTKCHFITEAIWLLGGVGEKAEASQIADKANELAEQKGHKGTISIHFVERYRKHENEE